MTIRSQGFASVRIIILAAVLGNWLTHPASAQLAEISAQLTELMLDCGAVRRSHQSIVDSANASRNACNRSNPGKYSTLRGRSDAACVGSYIAAEVCRSAAMAVCQVRDARDAAVADCRAKMQVQRMLQVAEDRRRAEEERRRRQGIDMAQEAAEALNERRGGSPAHELSRELTDHALKRLGAEAHSALDSLDQAFEDFDRESPNQSFRKHAVEQNTFLPMKDNANPPPEPFDVPDSYFSLMDLADATADKEYDLPLGDSFSSVGPGQKRWRLATDAALEGNRSVFAGGGRVGIPTDATGPSGSGSGSASRRQAPAFDGARARQVLNQAAQADRRHDAEAQEKQARRAQQAKQAQTKRPRNSEIPMVMSAPVAAGPQADNCITSDWRVDYTKNGDETLMFYNTCNRDITVWFTPAYGYCSEAVRIPQERACAVTVSSHVWTLTGVRKSRGGPVKYNWDWK